MSNFSAIQKTQKKCSREAKRPLSPMTVPEAASAGLPFKAAHALIFCENHLLVVEKRASSEKTIPGGKLETTDSNVLACVAREIHEETGLRMADLKQRGEPRLLKPAQSMIFVFDAQPAVRFKTLVPRPGDTVVSAKWVAIADVPGMLDFVGRTSLAMFDRPAKRALSPEAASAGPPSKRYRVFEDPDVLVLTEMPDMAL